MAASPPVPACAPLLACLMTPCGSFVTSGSCHPQARGPLCSKPFPPPSGSFVLILFWGGRDGARVTGNSAASCWAQGCPGQACPSAGAASPLLKCSWRLAAMGGSSWTAGGWQQAALTWCAGSHSLQLATSCCLGVEVTGKFLLIVPGRQLRRPGRVAGPQRQCVHLHGKDPATACWPQPRRATCCVPSIGGRSLLPAPGAGV